MFNSYMNLAIQEAQAAAVRGEVPVGAVLVKDNQVLARNGNRTLELNDPTAHAEMLVIREAAANLGSQRLTECDLYVTLEPCPMCAAAISFARIRRLYFGAYDEKSGGAESGVNYFAHPSCHHAPEVYGGLSAEESAEMLRVFFAQKR
ncbi:MAG: tRNA-specific adenosine deaminase [Hyphomicrobiales bacterium]|nr:MAG: tRNA-specific adenosine deaminase [Hyphomicrobiales bacterium]